jgi:hypothetical protein
MYYVGLHEEDGILPRGQWKPLSRILMERKFGLPKEKLS